MAVRELNDDGWRAAYTVNGAVGIKCAKTIVPACANRKLAVSWAGCLATGQRDHFLISISPGACRQNFKFLIDFSPGLHSRIQCAILLHVHCVTIVMNNICYSCVPNVWYFWQRCIRIGSFDWIRNYAARSHPPFISLYRLWCQIWMQIKFIKKHELENSQNSMFVEFLIDFYDLFSLLF